MSKSIKLKNNTYFDGEICDMGENENGTYIKWANGLMICTKKVTWTGVIENAWGSMFDSATINLGNYACNFLDVPLVFANQNSNNGALIESIFYTTNKSFGSCWLCRAKTNTNTTYYINCLAIGRWK